MVDVCRETRKFGICSLRPMKLSIRFFVIGHISTPESSINRLILGLFSHEAKLAAMSFRFTNLLLWQVFWDKYLEGNAFLPDS